MTNYTNPSEQIEEIFGQALELSADERGAFLDGACANDAALRGELESLLSHHAGAPEDFLRADPIGINRPRHRSDNDDDPLIGVKVGDFHIRAIIASGGMGTVYEATQTNPERSVALKVMRTGLASQRAIQRFEFEAQILARLRHPHIAQIFAAGVHTPSAPSRAGWPYFALELIPHARSITEFCEERKLGRRAKLEMFAKVCDAVHHGHQKGIIHRDLKPANIMVDADGEPKVIDFGVARSTDSDVAITTMRTDVAPLLGTLQYMSPEQCDADVLEIDTRTDVYSLGVVLYELLTGALPYDVSGTTIYRATRIIKEHLPIEPSSVRRELRGDVDVIVLKALEKDCSRRYQSAAALADDIRRHLNHEPIDARRPTLWTRAARWVMRNPMLTTSVTCLGIGFITLVTTYAFVWFVNRQPFKFIKTDDGREARIIARSGACLSSLSVGDSGGIAQAALIDRSEESGGGRLGIIGFSAGRTKSYAGSLCVFDAAGDIETDRPIWCDHISDDDIPHHRLKRPMVGSDFGLRWFRTFDLFPEHPGPEIVSLYACSFSGCAIRITNQEGVLLYQVWHDGTLHPCYWMSDAGLLVFSGLNSEAYWKQRGHSDVVFDHARVVFAIRPREGSIAADFLSSEQGHGPWSTVWYKSLSPPAANDQVAELRLHQPTNAADPRLFINVGLTLKKFEAFVWWTIDAFGQPVPGTRECNDAYSRHLDELPALDFFQLDSLPPIISSAGD